MAFSTGSSPHIRSAVTTSRIMIDVLIALLPATIFGIIHFGYNAFLVCCTGFSAAVLTESAYCTITRKPNTITDFSAGVTGLLLALIVPPSTSVFVVALGAVFSVLVVKLLFGGLGQNIFNPALAGRAFLLLLFPAMLTRYTGVDGVTAATPLHHMQIPALPEESLLDMFLGTISGSIGETSALALLVGGAYLVYRGVLKLRIPVSYLATVAVLTLIFNKGQDPIQWMLYNLLGGGLILGAIFMASDYATSPATPGGQVLYGIGCGILTVVFRYTGLYPEGVTYAILLMNATSWLFEYFTPTRLFGAPQKKGGIRQ